MEVHSLDFEITNVLQFFRFFYCAQKSLDYPHHPICFLGHGGLSNTARIPGSASSTNLKSQSAISHSSPSSSSRPSGGSELKAVGSLLVMSGGEGYIDFRIGELIQYTAPNYYIPVISPLTSVISNRSCFQNLFFSLSMRTGFFGMMKVSFKE